MAADLKTYFETHYPKLLGPGLPYHATREFTLQPGHKALFKALLDDLMSIDQGFQEIVICQIGYSPWNSLHIAGRGFSEAQLDRVRQAELESLNICEDCGEPGRPRELCLNYSRTLCDQHAESVPTTLLSIELPASFYEELNRVATISGMSVRDFTITALHERIAVATVLDRADKGTFVWWGERQVPENSMKGNVYPLSTQHHQRLLNALSQPPKPTEDLKKLSSTEGLARRSSAADVYQRAHDIFSIAERAHEWMGAALQALNGKRPVDLIDTHEGRKQVLDVLRKIEHGDPS